MSAPSPSQPPSLPDLVADISRPRRAGVLVARLVSAPRIGDRIARMFRRPALRPHRMARVTRLHARLLRLSRGRLRRSWLFAAGQPVMALTTVGRRSGRPRTTAVAAFRHRDVLAIAAMNLGSERDPNWARNLEADPDATIQVRGRAIPVTARRARGAEAAELWQRWLEVQPSAETFRRLAGRDIPIFVLEPRPGA